MICNSLKMWMLKLVNVVSFGFGSYAVCRKDGVSFMLFCVDFIIVKELYLV